MNTVIMIVGFPAAGKSTVASRFIDDGYVHINRDKMGGKIIELIPFMDIALTQGKNVVLDNTFPTIESRRQFIALAKIRKTKIICIKMTSTIEDAQFNACRRMMQNHGKILSYKELAETKSPNMFPPVVLFNYGKQFEEPTLKEGFDEIIEEKYIRKLDIHYNNKAILLDYDGTLRRTKSGAKFPTTPDDIEILPGRTEFLKQKIKEGYKLFGISNQSGVAKGDFTYEEAKACFDKTNELLGLDIEVMFCPHSVPPINCYCRKPMPGMPVYFMEKYKLDPSQCIIVGDMTSDKTCAKRAGMKFVNESEFFPQIVKA